MSKLSPPPSFTPNTGLEQPGQAIFNSIIEGVADMIWTRIEARLAGNPQNKAQEDTEIIDRKVLCERLQITEPTAITWGKKGKIPFIRIGSHIRYNWPKVLEALSNKKTR